MNRAPKLWLDKWVVGVDRRADRSVGSVARAVSRDVNRAESRLETSMVKSWIGDWAVNAAGMSSRAVIRVPSDEHPYCLLGADQRHKGQPVLGPVEWRLEGTSDDTNDERPVGLQ